MSRQPRSRKLERPLRGALRFVKNSVRASPRLRSVLLDLENADHFGDLFAHEKMLADRVRVDAYEAATRQLIGPDDVVIDVGTGTSILALLAARRARHVHAIDHSPFIAVAEEVARANHQRNVTFLRANSRDVKLPEPVDVILHEQMGAALFDENMLENLLDLKRRLLKPGGRIIPARFELFVEPVALRPEYRVPFVWEHELHGISFQTLQGARAARAHERDDYHLRRHLLSYAFERLLAEPQPLLRVDLDELTDASSLPRTVRAERQVLAAGDLDGFCIYFRVDFGAGVELTTAPDAPMTHWGNTMFRVARQRCAAGDRFDYAVTFGVLGTVASWTIEHTIVPAGEASVSASPRS